MSRKKLQRFFRVNFVLTFCLFLILVFTFYTGSGISSEIKPADFPRHWAKPLQARGLDRFAKVDEGLYRGKQPKEKGYESLKEAGIRSVLNLRASDPADEKKSVEKSGMQFVHFPQGATGVDEDNLVKFLKYATDVKNRPVFVHCRQGVDRTGTNVAVYRIIVHGWSKDEAIKEMYGFGYNHNLYGQLEEYLRNFDPAALAKKAGLPYPPQK